MPPQARTDGVGDAMARLTYEEMSDEFARLTEAYFDAVSAAPKGTLVVFDGYPTTDVLVDLWKAHRAALAAAFEAGGWTEAEWEAEVERRVTRVQHGHGLA